MARLVGYDNFKKHNPRSDKFGISKYHHIEFWCADATNTFKRFQHGLGMTLVAKSEHSTGNSKYCSYVLQSNAITFAITAPYSRACHSKSGSSSEPLAGFDQQQAYDFICTHGLTARAIGVEVDDATEAYEISVAQGAHGVRAPTPLQDGFGGTAVVSEVTLYGDVVLRYISGTWQGPFLPGYVATPDEPEICYGLLRLDHVVGNVPDLIKQVEHVVGFTGFHEFAEFTAADVNANSGLNHMVLANNTEMVLLSINEPTFGTKRKSQIQTYLEHNEGPGVQHLALKTNNIFETMRQMFSRSRYGGFDFQAAPQPSYYKRAKERVKGDVLSADEWAALEEMGILIDQDDEGVLLQIFTKPLGDRPTIFIEIIERRGCYTETHPAAAAAYGVSRQSLPGAAAGETFKGVDEATRDVIAVSDDGVMIEQAPGCGGFGKGNISELFKCIEEYEKTLKV